MRCRLYLDDLAARCRRIIGTRGNATSPDSVLSLAEAFTWKSLKLVNERELFHPKLYLFGYSGEPTVAWIGSANFTGNGMEANTELVLETSDSCAVAPMEDWFRNQWTALQQNPKQEFAAYKDQWSKPGGYVGDGGGLELSGTIRIRPTSLARKKREKLRGEIVYGPGRPGAIRKCCGRTSASSGKAVAWPGGRVSEGLQDKGRVPAHGARPVRRRDAAQEVLHPKSAHERKGEIQHPSV